MNAANETDSGVGIFAALSRGVSLSTNIGLKKKDEDTEGCVYYDRSVIYMHAVVQTKITFLYFRNGVLRKRGTSSLR